MTRKKAPADTEPQTLEVEVDITAVPEKPKKADTKKEISDLEVARKLVNIHSSAQSRNLEFSLTFECVKKLLEYNTCYYTNHQFTEDGPHQRTFDRIDNEKGYVVGRYS